MRQRKKQQFKKFIWIGVEAGGAEEGGERKVIGKNEKGGRKRGERGRRRTGNFFFFPGLKFDFKNDLKKEKPKTDFFFAPFQTFSFFFPFSSH